MKMKPNGKNLTITLNEQEAQALYDTLASHMTDRLKPSRPNDDAVVEEMVGHLAELLSGE